MIPQAVADILDMLKQVFYKGETSPAGLAVIEVEMLLMPLAWELYNTLSAAEVEPQVDTSGTFAGQPIGQLIEEVSKLFHFDTQQTRILEQLVQPVPLDPAEEIAKARQHLVDCAEHGRINIHAVIAELMSVERLFRKEKDDAKLLEPKPS